jgi:hypothetical protein
LFWFDAFGLFFIEWLVSCLTTSSQATKAGTQLHAACSFRNIGVAVNLGATPFKHAPALATATSATSGNGLSMALRRVMRSTVLAHLKLVLNSIPMTVGLGTLLTFFISCFVLVNCFD